MSKTIFLSVVIILIICTTNSSLQAKNIQNETVLTDTLVEGVVYKEMLFGKRKDKIKTRVLEWDISNINLKPFLLKAGNVISELMRLNEMIELHNNTFENTIVGGVNASFWRAYSNYPIGCTIKDSEVIELNHYKKWSSIFFDKTGKPYIDTFRLNANLEFNDGCYPIKAFNRRSDSSGIVVYNRFGGDTIPYVRTLTINEIMNNNASNFDSEDSTELEMTIQMLNQQLLDSKRSEEIEFYKTKYVFYYLDSPEINKETKCKLIAIKDGAVGVPTNGIIISFGDDFPKEKLPKLGDDIVINISSLSSSDITFANGLSATPRLIRNGKAEHEAYLEGSKSTRFISKHLARTAIGYNKDKTKMWLVSVRGSDSKSNIKGASLTEMSWIMFTLGCYEAMNLDGGGSSGIYAKAPGKALPTVTEQKRRISLGLGIKLQK